MREEEEDLGWVGRPKSGVGSWEEGLERGGVWVGCLERGGEVVCLERGGGARVDGLERGGGVWEEDFLERGGGGGWYGGGECLLVCREVAYRR